MRGFLIVVWAAAILICTCTASFNGLMANGEVSFHLNPAPNFSELLAQPPVEIASGFLVHKFGHLFAFFIFTILLQKKFQSKRAIFFLATFYAVLTEFLQLYFKRDGRLFDVGIDAAGILLALGMGRIFMTHHLRDTNL
ncbi:VanZ family protein [Neobacillus mesonae]|uniref:VanZ family protein n=1 Tax=Neobacillus mesonae TaxID=1193713 RepID=UPI002572FF7B|nr:VanZ family protein [Neobacillus mesonae]